MMRKIVLSSMLVIGFLSFSLFAKNEDYQSFFPIPIEEFYGGTTDKLAIQFECLKGSHLKKGSHFDPFRFPYCNLMKFVPSPYQEVDPSYFSGTNEERRKLEAIYNNIIEISSFFYKISLHKDRFHQQLQHFFHYGKNLDLQRKLDELVRVCGEPY